ncbi:MAG: 30S ribosomal protein S8 [bacterium]
MMTDTIADMLTRLRNASLVKKDQTMVPISRLKGDILRILKNHNYIADYEEIDSASGKEYVVSLRYDQDGQPVIRHIKRISTPGRRVYSGSKELKSVLNGLGLAILSTSKGLMTDREARKASLGGEIICEIW